MTTEQVRKKYGAATAAWVLAQVGNCGHGPMVFRLENPKCKRRWLRMTDWIPFGPDGMPLSSSQWPDDIRAYDVVRLDADW